MVHCEKCGNELPEGATYCPKCGSAVEGVTELRLAFWGERFVAWLIDVIIIGVAVELVRLFLWVGWPGYAWAPFFPNWIPFVDMGLSNVMYFLYWMFMDGIYGQSIGKAVMRIKVTRLDGKPMDMGQAALESVGKAFLLPLDCILGLIFYPKKRQRIFSYLSQTIVVRTSR